MEDNPDLLKLTVKALGQAGFDVRGVACGTEAMDRVAADPCLVLLLDQSLPE